MSLYSKLLRMKMAEFEAIWVYRASSKATKVILRNIVLKTQRKRKKKEKKNNNKKLKDSVTTSLLEPLFLT